MCGNKDTQYMRTILYLRNWFIVTRKGWEVQNKRDENEDLLTRRPVSTLGNRVRRLPCINWLSSNEPSLSCLRDRKKNKAHKSIINVYLANSVRQAKILVSRGIIIIIEKEFMFS